MKDMLDVAKIRRDFPMLSETTGAVRGSEGPLRAGRFAYLDTASSSLTPVQVLETQDAYYRTYRANVHRGMYQVSERATERYEATRRKIADLIRANEDEIVFTRGTTESLNMVAHSLARTLGKGDEVVMTAMEHHANLVPWQQYARQYGFALKFIPVTGAFLLDMDAARAAIGPATKVLTLTLASNVLGTIVPVAEIATLARAVGATVIVDAAQAVGHFPVDVRKLDCDFLAFSGHKMLGPTGTGVLYGKKAQLEALEPMLFGGDMIRHVTFAQSAWNDVPWKFEAGTPNIAGVIGLGAAADYVRLIGVERIAAHEQALVEYAIPKLRAVKGVRIIGPDVGEARTGVVSFEVEAIHPHDVATILDAEGVCVRGGHHCAMPLLQSLHLMNGTTRASFGIYSTTDDVDVLVAGIEKARRIFRLN